MARFRYIRIKRCLSLSKLGWLVGIFMTFIVFTSITLFRDADYNHLDGAIIQNRQILEEKIGLSNREEELLQLADELQFELLKSQKRITKRVAILKRGSMTGRERHSRADSGIAPEQRLKRRLMDAKPSGGVGLGSSGGSSTWDVTYEQIKAVEGVKVNRSDNANGILKNALEHRRKSKSTTGIKPLDNNVTASNSLPQNPHVIPTIMDKGARKKLSVSDSYDSNSGDRLRQTYSSSNSIISKSRTSIVKYMLSSNSNSRGAVTSKLKSQEHEGYDVRKHSTRIHVTTGNRSSGMNNDLNRNYGVNDGIISSNTPLLGCGDLTHLESREHAGSGYTKRVERARLGDGRLVALKSVWRDGKDVTACTDQGMMERHCMKLANYKVLKEVALLQQLQHPNILKLLGFCVNDEQSPRYDEAPPTVVIVENGNPIRFLNFLQMSWEDRLRVSVGISRLLAYLAQSTLGSLAIHDFKLSQFVIVDGEIKLADLDDVDDGLRTCTTTADCGLQIGTNDTTFTACRDGLCVNYSQMSNVVHAHTVFFSLLQFEAPPGMDEMISQLLNNTKRASWMAEEVLRHMDRLLHYYTSGKYMETNDNDVMDSNPAVPFKVVADHDLPGADDYWCPGSRHLSATCVVSVHDDREAKRMCIRDLHCHAFVMTSDRTWTDRQLVYFKKGVSSPQHSKGNTLYIIPR